MSRSRRWFRLPGDGEAEQLCRQGLRPAEIERALNGGAGLDYLAKRWRMTARDMAGLAVYYGVIDEDEADAVVRRIYDVDV